MHYKLSNPDGSFVKSAHISYCGNDVYSCSVTTCYSNSSECFRGENALRKAKIWFGINYMKGGKWVKEEILS